MRMRKFTSEWPRLDVQGAHATSSEKRSVARLQDPHCTTRWDRTSQTEKKSVDSHRPKVLGGTLEGWVTCPNPRTTDVEPKVPRSGLNVPLVLLDPTHSSLSAVAGLPSIVPSELDGDVPSRFSLSCAGWSLEGVCCILGRTSGKRGRVDFRRTLLLTLAMNFRGELSPELSAPSDPIVLLLQSEFFEPLRT